MTCWIT